MTFQRHSIYTQRNQIYYQSLFYTKSYPEATFTLQTSLLHLDILRWFFFVELFILMMQLCGQNQIPMWPDSYALVTVLTATKTSHTGGGHTEASTEVTVSITLKGCSCNHMTLLCMWHLYWGVCGCTVEAGMWWSDDMNGFSNALSTENFVIITVTLRKIRHKHKLTWVTSELGTTPPPKKNKTSLLDLQ